MGAGFGGKNYGISFQHDKKIRKNCFVILREQSIHFPYQHTTPLGVFRQTPHSASASTAKVEQLIKVTGRAVVNGRMLRSTGQPLKRPFETDRYPACTEYLYTIQLEIYLSVIILYWKGICPYKCNQVSPML